MLWAKPALDGQDVKVVGGDRLVPEKRPLVLEAALAATAVRHIFSEDKRITSLSRDGYRSTVRYAEAMYDWKNGSLKGTRLLTTAGSNPDTPRRGLPSGSRPDTLVLNQRT
jgi:hypothetical protein